MWGTNRRKLLNYRGVGRGRNVTIEDVDGGERIKVLKYRGCGSARE